MIPCVRTRATWLHSHPGQLHEFRLVPFGHRHCPDQPSPAPDVSVRVLSDRPPTLAHGSIHRLIGYGKASHATTCTYRHVPFPNLPTVADDMS